MSEMEGLEEETGLTCMVCHEGYKCKVGYHDVVRGAWMRRLLLRGVGGGTGGGTWVWGYIYGGPR